MRTSVPSRLITERIRPLHTKIRGSLLLFEIALSVLSLTGIQNVWSGGAPPLLNNLTSVPDRLEVVAVTPKPVYFAADAVPGTAIAVVQDRRIGSIVKEIAAGLLMRPVKACRPAFDSPVTRFLLDEIIGRVTGVP